MMPKVKDVNYYKRRVARELTAIAVFICDNDDDPQLCGKYIGCEINPEYIRIAEKRIANEMGLFNSCGENG